MKLCDPHWQRLRTEVIDLGMGKLIAGSGEAIHSRLVAEAEHGPTRETFDPLMGAYFSIVSYALEIGGLELLVGEADKCPLCALQAAHDASCSEPGCTFQYAERWIPGAARDMLAQAKHLGLVGDG